MIVNLFNNANGLSASTLFSQAVPNIDQPVTNTVAKSIIQITLISNESATEPVHRLVFLFGKKTSIGERSASFCNTTAASGMDSTATS